MPSWADDGSETRCDCAGTATTASPGRDPPGAPGSAHGNAAVGSGVGKRAGSLSAPEHGPRTVHPDTGRLRRAFSHRSGAAAPRAPRQSGAAPSCTALRTAQTAPTSCFRRAQDSAPGFTSPRQPGPLGQPSRAGLPASTAALAGLGRRRPRRRLHAPESRTLGSPGPGDPAAQMSTERIANTRDPAALRPGTPASGTHTRGAATAASRARTGLRPRPAPRLPAPAPSGRPRAPHLAQASRGARPAPTSWSRPAGLTR